MPVTNYHFDPTKNVLPQNWLNENATKYYNREYWKKTCPCDPHSFGTSANWKDTSDKWQPYGYYVDKWNKDYIGSPCESQFNGRNFASSSNSIPCEGPCTQSCTCGSDPCRCNIIFIRPCIERPSCPDLVDFKYPIDGSKIRFLKQFSDEFVEANRYQCMYPAQFGYCPQNIVDNLRKEEFTPSDQMALVKRGFKNIVFAREYIYNKRNGHMVPSSISENSTYYYLNHYPNSLNGLKHKEITGDIKYFDACGCNV
jgi:hypothetical protein